MSKSEVGAVFKWTCITCGWECYIAPPIQCPKCKGVLIRLLQKVHKLD